MSSLAVLDVVDPSRWAWLRARQGATRPHESTPDADGVWMYRRRMAPRIALIHAMQASMAPIDAAFDALWPEARRAHLLDDALPADLERAGRVDDALRERFVALARYAQRSGADAVLFTCSAFGDAIEAARAALALPVHAPNAAMLERAVRSGPRLALLATYAPTLTSMRPELEAAARASGRHPEVAYVHVADAIAALRRGDVAAHDERIAAAAAEQAPGTVIALAQFSMARAAERVAERVPGAVLTTPGAAVRALRDSLAS